MSGDVAGRGLPDPVNGRDVPQGFFQVTDPVGLADDPRVQGKPKETTRSGAFTVLPITDADLPEIERLMLKYSDRPMDFADASLVLLAQREALVTVFTIDHDDFETYRLRGRQKFRIFPPR